LNNGVVLLCPLGKHGIVLLHSPGEHGIVLLCLLGECGGVLLGLLGKPLLKIRDEDINANYGMHIRNQCNLFGCGDKILTKKLKVGLGHENDGEFCRSEYGWSRA
jgi:hypothetical protein